MKFCTWLTTSCKINMRLACLFEPKFSVGFGKEIKIRFFIQYFNILLQANLFLKDCRDLANT